MVSAAIRRIPLTIPSLEELGAPKTLLELIQKPSGLILITGSTGSGKSTTLASLVDWINQNRRDHILTIEDPIEFVFEDLKATITQRELGRDFISLAQALKGSLRQDPDVIVLGEMRDLESIKAAISAAETGHLVLSTLHTNDAKSSIERILDSFPGDQQNQIRVQLSHTLLGVVSQKLISRADKQGRILSTEVMVKSPSIEQCIRKGEYELIQDLMNQSEVYYGMHTFNVDLERLVRAGIITADEAILNSSNPDDLRLRLSGVDRKEGY